MSFLKKSIAELQDWGFGIEREISIQQKVSADPNKERQFRLIGQDEFLDLTKASIWQWRSYVKELKDAGVLPESSNNRYQITLRQVHDFMDAQGIRPRRPEGLPEAISLAVSNFKGGAAKSTLTFHLATRLAMRGYRVLAIDLDGQATLTRLLAFDPDTVRPQDTIAAALGMHVDEGGELMGGDPLPLQPRQTFISGLDLLPSTMSVTSMDMELMHRIRENRFGEATSDIADAMRTVAQDYDIVLMDFQPSFSFAQTMVMYQAHGLLIPVPTETPDLAGTGDFLRLSGKWLLDLDALFQQTKVFDPVLALHVRSKLRGAPAGKKLSDREQAELEEQMAIANTVFGASGRVFGGNRPPQIIEDLPVISKCLSDLKSVYEGDPNTDNYDRRALKKAREQYDAIVDRVIRACEERWEEIVAQGGQA